MNCDQVFDVLTRGPFPSGGASDGDVERHLRACHDCRLLAEALRPAVELMHECLELAETEALPGYRGQLDEVAGAPDCDVSDCDVSGEDVSAGDDPGELGGPVERGTLPWLAPPEPESGSFRRRLPAAWESRPPGAEWTGPTTASERAGGAWRLANRLAPWLSVAALVGAIGLLAFPPAGSRNLDSAPTAGARSATDGMSVEPGRGEPGRGEPGRGESGRGEPGHLLLAALDLPPACRRPASLAAPSSPALPASNPKSTAGNPKSAAGNSKPAAGSSKPAAGSSKSAARKLESANDLTAGRSTTLQAAYLCCTHCHVAGGEQATSPATLAVTIRSCDACHHSGRSPLSPLNL